MPVVGSVSEDWLVVEWPFLSFVSCLCRVNLGMDLTRSEVGGNEALFKVFWHHTDAIVCCAWKVSLLSTP